MDQQHVVGRIIAGDSDAATTFVRDYEPRIRRVVREARIPEADAPDVVQEVFIEAIRQLVAGRFEYRAALGTWLRTIAAGRIVDY